MEIAKYIWKSLKSWKSLNCENIKGGYTRFFYKNLIF